MNNSKATIDRPLGRRKSIVIIFCVIFIIIIIAIYCLVFYTDLVSHGLLKETTSMSRSSGSTANNIAESPHTAAVIFLHGLGGSANGMVDIMKNRQPHVKYIFPTAEKLPITLNGGRRMPAWFNVFGLKPDSQEDEEGIKAGARILQLFISKLEAEGIQRNRIVVGGLSQGGACTLYSSFALPQQPLAGIIGLSTWLPLLKTFPQAAKSNLKTPVLLCHGDNDAVVGYDFGQLTYERIKTFNENVQFKTYHRLRHWVNDQEMNDVSKFILDCLPVI